ncbi:DUF429 domain-containing protein [Pontibacter burrus]|uniref:DUF429 domain-containing protein n=1 Tax=Pontibacter burrus TaxID=2704466 RepID=A0A6B3LTZ4_9BACT|nr:DUF429 domain-containing protein [Pontibacter burrus]NEM97468.1 DUF429 domain-containing protein [Pontibacter burrus]
MPIEDLPVFMGVDYGARLAGTTAAAMLHEGSLNIWGCARSQDADEFLLELIQAVRPAIVFIDAPLSLPKAYNQTPYTSDADFFYRACDREVQAMSPMFIGGLTARAIRLKTILSENGISVLETYPSQLAETLFPEQKGYKKDITLLPEMAQQLQELHLIPVKDEPQDWHQFDAQLAWYSGYRHLMKQSTLYGDPEEGRIIV